MSNQQKSHHPSRNANKAVLEVFFKDIYNAKDLMESCLTKGEKALFSLFSFFRQNNSVKSTLALIKLL